MLQEAASALLSYSGASHYMVCQESPWCMWPPAPGVGPSGRQPPRCTVAFAPREECVQLSVVGEDADEIADKITVALRWLQSAI